jgi:hypothetical protein
MTPPSWLTTLLEKGAVGYSAVNHRALDELLTLEIVSIQSRGIRRTVVAIQPEQLARWTAARYPDHGLDPNRLATRQGNIVRSGRSKTGRSAHAVLPFSFKWFGSPNEQWTRLTRDFGMAAVMTDRLSDLCLPKHWHLLTIENWEPFHHADYTDAIVPVMVVYLGGNASEVLIAAMQSLAPPPSRVLHFGDFDWDGLYIFQRLKGALPSARLYVPANIASLFSRFGDRQLIARQTPKAAFDRRNRDCRPIIDLIEQHNAGLEQEIVDLPLLI